MYRISVSFINCDPSSVMICGYVSHVVQLDVSAEGVNYHDDMRTPMSVGNGPIVSITIRVIGNTVDTTNRDTFKTACNRFIFDKWDNIV